jgi:hypothetical protein
MRILIATLIALMLFATTPVVAGDYEDGLAAFTAGDYQKAVGLFEPLAKQGDARAQYGLGVMYHEGNGVSVDNAEAVHWYTKAAKQGHATAQYNLGHMYKQVSRTETTHSSQHLPLCSHIGPGQPDRRLRGSARQATFAPCLLYP